MARREPPPARLVWGVCGGGGPPPAPGGRRARPWGCSAVRGRAESRSRLSWRRQEFLRRISSAAAVQPTRPPPVPPGPPPPSGEPNRAADRARDAAPVGARCRPSRRWGHPGEGGSGVRVGAAVTPPRHGAGFGAAAPGRALGPSAGGTYGARPGAAANVCSIWERRADTSKYRHWPSASAARPRGHGPPPPPPLGTPPERAEPRLAGCAQRCPRPTALCLRFPSGRRAERSRQRAELGARCRPVPP